MEFSDDYTHDIPGVIYISSSLPSREVQNLFDYTLEGCNCETECTRAGGCSCLNRSGTSYKYPGTLDIKNYVIEETGLKSPTYECNDNCVCSDSVCGNKLVQFGPRKNLMVSSCSNEKGLGLFARKPIKNGNFVCEYAGEIITEEEALRRFTTNNNPRNTNYIFCIKEHFGAKLVKTFIDPTHYGNIGRYINHSCAPNCRLFTVRINDAIPVLAVFAADDIGENTEITYDYGNDSDNRQRYERKTCLCGSDNCRKFLPFDITLTADL